jgi:hypothetical protein
MQEVAIRDTTQPAFSLTPRNLEEALKFAEIMSKSDLVPRDFRDKPGNILVAIQKGLEIGLSPMAALESIAVINGRASLWGDALLGLVQVSPQYEWHNEAESTPTKGVCIVKRKGHEPHRVEFSIEDAKRAGLLGKSGPWQQYTARMLTLRARAFALRDKFADVLKGLSMAEEALDSPQSQPQTVSAEVQPAAPPSLKDKLKARLEEPTAVVVEAVQPSPAQALQDAAQELAGEPVEVTVEDTSVPPPFVWRMGKWKSAHIADIDTSYLEWFVESGKDGDHKEAARAELERRQNQVSLMGSESEEVA